MRFPDAVAAAGIPLHVLVRDFPETLAVLRARGVDIPAAAGRPLGSSGDQPAVPGTDVTPEQLIAAMAAAAAWRDPAPPGPCDRAADNARAHAAAAARERARPAGRD